MIEIRWAEEAMSDLDRLQHFLLRAAPEVADLALNRIERAVSSLSDFPRLGRLRSAADHEREFLADFGRNAYVIRYRVLSHEHLLILRVFHSRENR